MRAYRKSTSHPYCVYLTSEEGARLLNEMVTADPELFPTVSTLYRKLNSVYGAKEGKRA
jgi:hypothetical protein